jgi:hypothetical protein
MESNAPASPDTSAERAASHASNDDPAPLADFEAALRSVLSNPATVAEIPALRATIDPSPRKEAPVMPADPHDVAQAAQEAVPPPPETAIQIDVPPGYVLAWTAAGWALLPAAHVEPSAAPPAPVPATAPPALPSDASDNAPELAGFEAALLSALADLMAPAPALEAAEEQIAREHGSELATERALVGSSPPDKKARRGSAVRRIRTHYAATRPRKPRSAVVLPRLASRWPALALRASRRCRTWRRLRTDCADRGNRARYLDRIRRNRAPCSRYGRRARRCRRRSEHPCT